MIDFVDWRLCLILDSKRLGQTKDGSQIQLDVLLMHP